MSTERISQQEERERPYCQAARFDEESNSREAYQIAQQAIADAEADISAYRFKVRRIWHVAVVAEEAPSRALQRVLEQAISRGERTDLPIEVLTTLLNRHREVMRHHLPWVDGHYHPGRELPTE